MQRGTPVVKHRVRILIEQSTSFGSFYIRSYLIQAIKQNTLSGSFYIYVHI